MIRRLALCLALLAGPLAAETVVLGLSQDEVAITADFDGSDLLIFGAVKRETPLRLDAPVDVIITVSGPKRPLVVRRKARRLGIWVNTDAVEVDLAPTFYAVATSGPLQDVLSRTDDLRHKVSIPRAIRSVGNTTAGVADFTEALIRVRIRNGTYQQNEGSVDLDEQTLFHTRVSLPSDLTEGDYSTRIFLTRDGKVIDSYETRIPVHKVGLERWLFWLARERSLIYALLSLTIAIAAGWGASTAFRLLKR